MPALDVPAFPLAIALSADGDLVLTVHEESLPHEPLLVSYTMADDTLRLMMVKDKVAAMEAPLLRGQQGLLKTTKTALIVTVMAGESLESPQDDTITGGFSVPFRLVSATGD